MLTQVSIHLGKDGWFGGADATYRTIGTHGNPATPEINRYRISAYYMNPFLIDSVPFLGCPHMDMDDAGFPSLHGLA